MFVSLSNSLLLVRTVPFCLYIDKILINFNLGTVEPRSTSASLYEKFALRAAIRKEFCLIRRVKIRSTSDRRPSTSRGLEIRFRSL